MNSSNPCVDFRTYRDVRRRLCAGSNFLEVTEDLRCFNTQCRPERNEVERRILRFATDRNVRISAVTCGYRKIQMLAEDMLDNDLKVGNYFREVRNRADRNKPPLLVADVSMRLFFNRLGMGPCDRQQ